MLLKNSRYYQIGLDMKTNPWKEVTISDEWMRDAIAPVLQKLSYVRSMIDVDKVIVTDHHNGTYKLTYSTSRRKEGGNN